MRHSALVLALATSLLVGCSWKRCAYEGFTRDGWQEPDRVIAALGLAPGQRVADLGAGTGYFTARLARAVGDSGRVYAVDVDADVLEGLAERMADEGVSNVETVVAPYDDAGIPDASVDLVFTVNTYHHFQERPAYFRKLKRVLKPGGRVAIIELDERNGLFVRWSGHYSERDLILDEMQEAGYRVARDHAFLGRQSFVEFAPN